MELIQNNPYRIAGIFAGATESELQRQKSKITKYASIGKEISSELDFSFLNKLDRNENEIKRAFSSIEQNQDKVRNALFWFINASPFDNTAIEYLKNGDNEKAVEIWEKVTKDKDVNSKNCSCFNNLGTLKLLGNSFDEIKEGIEAKVQLVESNSFVHFINIVADETYSVNNQKQIEILIDDILSQFKNKFSQSDLINLFDNCNGSTQNYLLKKFTEEPIFKIENQIESTKIKRKEKKKNAYEYGLNLFVNCKDDLASLKKILGVSDLKYKMLADNLAKEILQCGIDYFKEWENTKDPTEEGLKLLKYAKSVAISTQVLERIDSNIEGMEEFKDKEINQAVALLQSIKDAYETNETNIRQQVKRLEETDVQIKLGFKTINHSAVEDNIKNSIDWIKVNDLLREVLTDKNLTKIKESNKAEAKNEFWELLNWIEDYSQKSSTVSAIIEKYKNIPPKLYFEVVSAEVTNTDNKPFYIEYIRYVGILLKVKSTGNQKITFYKKYINPEGKYSHSSKSSPEGYTTSEIITITPQTKEIDLGGWGNGKECTYQVGEHKIEIYVEHYKVYTKTFMVDWSPSKKAELLKNIALLENELREVLAFKWFRASDTKQREVKELQDKINRERNILMNK